MKITTRDSERENYIPVIARLLLIEKYDRQIQATQFESVKYHFRKHIHYLTVHTY